MGQCLRASSFLALAFCIAPSYAATATYYTDFASWNAAVTGVVTVSVPDPGPAGFLDISGGATYSGVAFSQTLSQGDVILFNVGPPFGANPPVVSSQQGQVGTGLVNVTITLPHSVTGMAVFYSTFSGSSVTFALSNGASVNQGSTAAGYGTPDFYGVTDTSFDSVLITSPDDFVLSVNDISFDGNAVPEPGSWMLFAAGLAGVATYARRRAKRAA